MIQIFKLVQVSIITLLMFGLSLVSIRILHISFIATEQLKCRVYDTDNSWIFKMAVENDPINMAAPSAMFAGLKETTFKI